METKSVRNGQRPCVLLPSTGLQPAKGTGLRDGHEGDQPQPKSTDRLRVDAINCLRLENQGVDRSPIR